MPAPLTSDQAEIPVLTSPLATRRDIVSACTVEIGIYLQDLLGPRVAADFLKRHHVSLEVAHRALLQPSRRRYGR